MALSCKQQEYLKLCSHRWNIKVGATGSGKSWLDYAVVIPKRLLAMRGQGAAVFLGNTQGTLSRNILTPMLEIHMHFRVLPQNTLVKAHGFFAAIPKYLFAGE